MNRMNSPDKATNRNRTRTPSPSSRKVKRQGQGQGTPKSTPRAKAKAKPKPKPKSEASARARGTKKQRKSSDAMDSSSEETDENEEEEEEEGKTRPGSGASKGSASSGSGGKSRQRKKQDTGKAKDEDEDRDEDRDEPHYEFGGPLGVSAITLLLPLTVYFLYYAANKDFVLHLSDLVQFKLQFEHVDEKNETSNSESTRHIPMVMESTRHIPIAIESHIGETMQNFTEQLPAATDILSEWIGARQFAHVVAWFVFLVTLQYVLPANYVQGTKLKNGKKLKYNANAHLTFWVVLLLVACGRPKFSNDKYVGQTYIDLSVLSKDFIKYATSAIVFSFVLSIYLYAKSFWNPEGASNKQLAEGGQTGNTIYDWFIGRELNPRDLGNTFDWKEFCELRPGLIGWMLVNLGCLMHQQQKYGYNTPEMILVNLFQGIYVWDAVYNEASILTTMDIVTDGFGFMLAFGDLAWVPFTYSLQARFLVHHHPGLSTESLMFIVFLNFMGYTIFRMANSEKDKFRKDAKYASTAKLETMETENGKKLLVSGWWGIARKINYTGDWLMSLAWCATTGNETVVTYFYSIYFAILLIHRAMRDEEACRAKYGKDWPKYKEKVPYVFVPNLI